MKGRDLRNLIVESLLQQGFGIHGSRLSPPEHLDKDAVRQIHSVAVEHRIECARGRLQRHESLLLPRIANGSEVAPARIAPRLIEVRRGSQDEVLFRYVGLHWSIPVSSGYGRRLRFLVVDEHNGKLIGILGLGDPVYSVAARDGWIGWSRRARRQRLRHVMDAYVLGAVPPYSYLLCGKLVAMLAASDEVRSAFRRKYRGSRSCIARKRFDGRLALLTTTSALGRSSIYNRLTLEGRLVYQSVGFTRGSGDFHFLNGTYEVVREYADRFCEPTAKQEAWGTGFRNRREVVKKCLAQVGLSTEWLYHGIEREVFVIPLARNTPEFLRGDHSRLLWYRQSTQDMFAWFRERWLLPRAERVPTYAGFDREEYRIWQKPR